MERVRDAVKICRIDDATNRSDFESARRRLSRQALENFEGPLDLLLHLIKKNEVNIHDIPIALITQQYLDAIHLMQELNLDMAGEFLVMAATLIHIKSKMLLPRPETAAASRARRKIRATPWCAGCSSTRSSRRRPNCSTSASSCGRRSGCGRTSAWPSIAGDEYEPELEVDLFSLLSAFQAVVAAREAPAESAAAARADAGRSPHRAAARRGCRRPRRAGSRSCLPTSTIAAG